MGSHKGDLEECPDTGQTFEFLNKGTGKQSDQHKVRVGYRQRETVTSISRPKARMRATEHEAQAPSAAALGMPPSPPLGPPVSAPQLPMQHFSQAFFWPLSYLLRPNSMIFSEILP